MKGHLSVGLSLCFLIQGTLVFDVAAGRGHRSKREVNTTALCNDRPSHTHCLVDSPNATFISISGTNQKKIVDKHNSERLGANPKPGNMMKMKWNDSLANTAKKWAMQCVQDNDDPLDRQEPGMEGVAIGQNYLADTDVSLNNPSRQYRTFVVKFVNDRTNVDLIHGPLYEHHTKQAHQVLYHSTVFVGCALANCSDFLLFVCNYAPSMDWSQPSYSKGDLCASCSDHCQGGKYCDCGNKMCFNGGELLAFNCSCACPMGWSGDTCETEEVCGGKQCQNGGTLDSSCTCNCATGFTGDNCEQALGEPQTGNEVNTTTTNITCESKYSALSASHTRCLVDDPNAVLVPLNESDQSDIVDWHNEHRINVTPTPSNMMMLRWSENLAKTAEKLAMQCIFQHDAMGNRMEPDWPTVRIGQSVGSNHANFKVLIDNFAREDAEQNYTYGDNYTRGVGHYYQLVSGPTALVGCAKALCPGNDILVCNYAPAMNTAEPPYKSGHSCGDCPNHCDPSGKLCDCGGKLCYNRGTLDPATCDCQCQPTWTGDNCEEANCADPDPWYCGTLTRQHCGDRSTIAGDPNMCPHLCEICEKPCGGRVCQNGGTLDSTTCKCTCKPLLTGETCESCPPVDNDYCTNYRPKSECGIIHDYDCPIFCGDCNTNCQPCENHGALNTTDCTCKCKGGFTGSRCEICPSEDSPYICDLYYMVDNCTQVPTVYVTAQTLCPHLCGLCPNNATVL